jgi:hypothetical protein
MKKTKFINKVNAFYKSNDWEIGTDDGGIGAYLYEFFENKGWNNLGELLDLALSNYGCNFGIINNLTEEDAKRYGWSDIQIKNKIYNKDWEDDEWNEYTGNVEVLVDFIEGLL